jgi:hypothetical protein
VSRKKRRPGAGSSSPTPRRKSRRKAKSSPGQDLLIMKESDILGVLEADKAAKAA